MKLGSVNEGGSRAFGLRPAEPEEIKETNRKTLDVR